MGEPSNAPKLLDFNLLLTAKTSRNAPSLNKNSDAPVALVPTMSILAPEATHVSPSTSAPILAPAPVENRASRSTNSTVDRETVNSSNRDQVSTRHNKSWMELVRCEYSNAKFNEIISKLDSDLPSDKADIIEFCQRSLSHLKKQLHREFEWPRIIVMLNECVSKSEKEIKALMLENMKAQIMLKNMKAERDIQLLEETKQQEILQCLNNQMQQIKDDIQQKEVIVSESKEAEEELVKLDDEINAFCNQNNESLAEIVSVNQTHEELLKQKLMLEIEMAQPNVEEEQIHESHGSLQLYPNNVFAEIKEHMSKMRYPKQSLAAVSVVRPYSASSHQSDHSSSDSIVDIFNHDASTPLSLTAPIQDSTCTDQSPPSELQTVTNCNEEVPQPTAANVTSADFKLPSPCVSNVLDQVEDIQSASANIPSESSAKPSPKPTMTVKQSTSPVVIKLEDEDEPDASQPPECSFAADFVPDQPMLPEHALPVDLCKQDTQPGRAVQSTTQRSDSADRVEFFSHLPEEIQHIITKYSVQLNPADVPNEVIVNDQYFSVAISLWNRMHPNHEVSKEMQDDIWKTCSEKYVNYQLEQQRNASICSVVNNVAAGNFTNSFTDNAFAANSLPHRMPTSNIQPRLAVNSGAAVNMQMRQTALQQQPGNQSVTLNPTRAANENCPAIAIARLPQQNLPSNHINPQPGSRMQYPTYLSEQQQRHSQGLHAMHQRLMESGAAGSILAPNATPSVSTNIQMNATLPILSNNANAQISPMQRSTVSMAAYQGFQMPDAQALALQPQHRQQLQYRFQMHNNGSQRIPTSFSLVNDRYNPLPAFAVPNMGISHPNRFQVGRSYPQMPVHAMPTSTMHPMPMPSIPLGNVPPYSNLQYQNLLPDQQYPGIVRQRQPNMPHPHLR